MRSILLLLLTFLTSAALAPEGDAQVFAIELTEKAAKKHRKKLTLIDGQMLLVCENYKGIRYVPSKGTLTFSSDRNQVFLADPKDPLNVPYEVEGEEIEPKRKSALFSLAGKEIQRIRVLLPDHSLYSLGLEYENRLGQIEELREARDLHAKATAPWFLAHQKVVNAMERLHRFLASTAFPERANKYEKELEKERKTVAKEAVAMRKRAAVESVRDVDTPERLVEAAKNIGGGAWTFSVQESQHCRIVYHDGIDHDRVTGLLRLAETAIEGFRSDFIDPYLDDQGYKDRIPEGIYQEWFLGPDDFQSHDRFRTEYYGMPWGPNKEKAIEVNGQVIMRPLEPKLLFYWRITENADLEGLVASNTGNGLCWHHYQKGEGNGTSQAWLEQAVSYWVSLEYLGRNSVTAIQFDEERRARYIAERKKRKKGIKTVMLGTRDYFNSLALEYGVRIEMLAKKSLFEMDDIDLAKSWSYYDFVARKLGKEGQLWLQAACARGKVPASLVPEWRKDSEGIFEVNGTDVFRYLDGRWEEFATREQDTSGDARDR